MKTLQPVRRRARVRTAMAAAGVAAGLLLAVTPGAGQGQGQAPPYRAPRTASGKPDLNGIWQALNTANWDLEGHAAAPGPVTQLGAAYAVPPGLGVVEGGLIPYKPEAVAKRKENAANVLKRDAEVKCYLPGVPRMMYMPYPVQILQSDSYIIMLSEYASALRTTYMDSHKEAPADTWMGWSNGHWEGETLVIDTAGFLGGTITALDKEGALDTRFLDRAGNFHSDALHVVERITRTGPDHLAYDATIEDPNVFTRPWKISIPLYRRVEKNMQLGEFKCEEFVADLIYGKYYKEPPK